MSSLKSVCVFTHVETLFMFQFKAQQTRMNQNVRDYKEEERRGVWQYTLEPATLPDREYQNDIPTVLQ